CSIVERLHRVHVAGDAKTERRPVLSIEARDVVETLSVVAAHRAAGEKFRAVPIVVRSETSHVGHAPIRELAHRSPTLAVPLRDFADRVRAGAIETARDIESLTVSIVEIEQRKRAAIETIRRHARRHEIPSTVLPHTDSWDDRSIADEQTGTRV